ncbi:hypothetical protein ACHAXS_002582 [Conticribra weissflogii]
MDKIEDANKKLQESQDELRRDLDAELKKLSAKEKGLKDRLNELNNKKAECAEEHGSMIDEDDDFIEVNAGGKVIAAKRSTLTQLKETRLEALFSGRWDKKLDRDANGRIFLDVNPTCFQAIVDYLNEMTISCENNPPEPPSVESEIEHILVHQALAFGLVGKVFSLGKNLPDSTIIESTRDADILHDWLQEDGLDGDFNLLYRSSRDSRNDSTFHSKCDNKGPTLTVIKTSDGIVLGGYTDASWRSDCIYDSQGYNNYVSSATRSFLFVLSKRKFRMPSKMRMKANDNTYGSKGNYGHPSYGPSFGTTQQYYGYAYFDMSVRGSSLELHYLGNLYDAKNVARQIGNSTKTIQEMEVFQVASGRTKGLTMLKQTKKQVTSPKTIHKFTKNINDAINSKWKCLQDFENELASLEDAFKDEETFISQFFNGTPADITALNVRGSIMMINKSILDQHKQSVLAAKVVTEGRKDTDAKATTLKTIEKWSHEDVVAWMNGLEGVPDSVVSTFEGNEVAGRELVALGKEGMLDLGITRKPTIYFILNEIKKLQSASSNPEILIEHSPYCFEKIIDHLRLENAFVKNLVNTEPKKPTVRASEKARFKKVVEHYFPGDSSKFIL